MSAKRDLYAELVEGLDALGAHRKGQLSLRQHQLPAKEPAPVTPSELIALRAKLGVSRPDMARYLRTKDRTLDNWEQGRSVPNAQASALIRLVLKFPDMLQRLASI